MLIFADVPVLTIGLEAAATFGSLVGGGFVGAAKLIVGYFRERDAARDKIDAAREQMYVDKLTRELKDRTDLATRFADEVSHIETERRDMTRGFMEIQRETASVIAQTEAALRSLALRVGQQPAAQRKRADPDGG